MVVSDTTVNVMSPVSSATLMFAPVVVEEEMESVPCAINGDAYNNRQRPQATP
jgi:hypothetical protein